MSKILCYAFKKNLIKVDNVAQEYIIVDIDENNRKMCDYSNILMNELEHKVFNGINNLNYNKIEEFQ